MTRIATYELAARLPQLLARLAAGEEVLLTDAGRPVARVLPPIPLAPMAADRLRAFEALTALVRSRADRYPPGHVVDDDRESMYSEREAAPAVILLDTNVLLRYAHPNDPAHRIVHTDISRRLASGEALCIVPQNLYEFWVVATRPLAVNGHGFTARECRQVLDGLQATCTLLPDRPELLPEWDSLVLAHDCLGKVAHDARLVAAMRTHGLTALLTFNGADFRRFPDLTVLHPSAA